VTLGDENLKTDFGRSAARSLTGQSRVLKVRVGKLPWASHANDAQP